MTPYFITIWLMQVSEMRWCWDQYLWCSSGAQGWRQLRAGSIDFTAPLLPVTASRTSTTQSLFRSHGKSGVSPAFLTLLFTAVFSYLALVYPDLLAARHGRCHSCHIWCGAPGQSWLRVSTDFLFSFLDRINITHRIKAHHWARRLKTNTTQSHRTSAYPYPREMSWK